MYVSYGGATIYVYGGVISGSDQENCGGIYTGDYGSLKIYGGTIGGNIALISRCNTKIYGGSFSGKVDNMGNGYITISGGSFYDEIRNKSYNDINISGGSFSGTVSNGSSGSVSITGGTFTGALQNNGSGSLNIKSGTFKVDPSAYISDSSSYEVIPNTDGTYSVWKLVSDASGLAADLGRIKLVGNIDCGINLGIDNGSSVILDLNGYTLTTNQAIFAQIESGASLTILDTSAAGGGKLASSAEVPEMIKVGEGGTLTVNAGTLDAGTFGTTISADKSSTVTINNGTILGGAPIDSKGSVTINGGTLTNTGTYSATLWQRNGTLIVTSGTLPNINLSNTSGGTTTARISSGIVSGTLTVNDNVNLTVTGGTFKTADPTNYVPKEGYTVIKDEDGWMVAKDA